MLIGQSRVESDGVGADDELGAQFAEEDIDEIQNARAGPLHGIDATAATYRVTSLVRKPTHGRLTLPCETDGAERPLVPVPGPPKHSNREGIARGRNRLEEQTGSMAVRGGDYPLEEERTVAAVTLRPGVTWVPHIEQLQQVAIEAQEHHRGDPERERRQPEPAARPGHRGPRSASLRAVAGPCHVVPAPSVGLCPWGPHVNV